MKNITNIFIYFIIGITIQGCALVKSYSSKEFRNEKFYRRTVVIERSIEQILDIFAINSPITSGPYKITESMKIKLHLATLYIDISNDKKTATFHWHTDVWGYEDTLAIIDFVEDPVTKFTTAKLYYYLYFGKFDNEQA